MNIKIYSLLLVIQILISFRHLKTCKNINIYKFMIYTLHHLLDVYIFFGFFINETKNEHIFHLLLIMSILLHWFTNNYDCALTTYFNELCGFDKKLWFQSIMYKIYKLTNIYYIHSYWILGIIIYNLYKIIT